MLEDSTMIPPTLHISLSVPNHRGFPRTPLRLTDAAIRDLSVADATLRRIENVCDRVG
jgi:hypothetical protein